MRLHSAAVAAAAADPLHPEAAVAHIGTMG